MATYIWRDGTLVDKRTGELMVRPGSNAEICAPYVMRDLPDYRSPITGEVISGRAARREDLKKNDCVEVDPPKRKRGYRNKRFTEKFNLPYEG